MFDAKELANVLTLIAQHSREVPYKDQWCAVSSILPSLAFSNAAGDKAFPDVVLPAAGTFLPAGAVIQSVYLMVKWRKQYNSSAGANAINAAAKTIRIKKAADAWAASLVAMTMANGDWETVAGPAPAGVEGGDMYIGSVDIKGKVDAFGTTYNISSEQTVTGEGITVTAASLTLYGVATSLRIYYTLG